MHSQAEAHHIVWDEPSLEHSTWQGPPAFDFSQEPQLLSEITSTPDEPALTKPADEYEPVSYAQAPAQGRSGISTESSAAPAPLQENGLTSPQDDAPDDSLTIGRSRSNGIVLDDMLVSRRHVIITADDDGLLLRDLDSRNGTFVNGRRIDETHLQEGDRIGIGASTFEVRDGWLVAV